VYDYRVPPELSGKVAVGSRLAVPLHGRLVEGYCVGLRLGTTVPLDRLKDVAAVLDDRPVYPPASLELARWTARRYLCQPGEVLQAAIPAPRRLPRRRPGPEAAEGRVARRGPSRLHRIRPEGPGDGPDEASRGEAAPGAAVGPGSDPRGGSSPVKLTPGQEAALGPLLRAVKETGGGSVGGGAVFVLHGVTGSGKTEVFLRAAAEALARGRQVLLLVPEVALVHQTVARVRAHVGPARVAVAHSYLAGEERRSYWDQVVVGEADVVVGARSAVFAPLARLGLIVLDEEHEDAYKQEERAPRYHAREVAAYRAEREGAVLVLSSATPSLETYRRALEGQWTLLTLPERVGGRPLPPVEVVDMRAELAAGNRGVFSRRLREALADTLADGRQAILFLNRRGHSTFVLCRDCGWVARCPACDVSLTYHHPRGSLICHWCGHRAPAPHACPACRGHRVRYFGAGTQRVEEEARNLYPEARVVRLDADVVRRPGEAARVLTMVETGQADILVGTQMVAKGLDLPGVGLVAAVAADSALHLPDFRSAERTFRLLTQAAGRAGRGQGGGRVIVQTYSPDHPAVRYAVGHDYAAFARAELEARRALGYPPWTHLVRVELSGPEEDKVRAAAVRVADALAAQGFLRATPETAWAGGDGRPRLAGPAPAPIARLRGRHRWHVLVFSADLEQALEGARQAVREATGRPARGGRRHDGQAAAVAAVDVDPVSVL
ncbi:MAG: primosomal protein N', partial [Actinomycetia bacterium]|nr:primosomal protein N' [Actinomycetes bacterium]